MRYFKLLQFFGIMYLSTYLIWMINIDVLKDWYAIPTFITFCIINAISVSISISTLFDMRKKVRL